MFKHGLVVGKFMPLHNGHGLLIEAALTSCERLSIVLMSEPGDVIPGHIRNDWLETLYSLCTIVHIRESLPRDETGYDHWDVWLEVLLKHCTETYDAVFSSEEYGERLASDLRAEHILVDKARMAVSVSGTAIRANPDQYTNYLPAIVREYYENQN